MIFTGISGGRTSAYVAANYPADKLLFSLVCVDDPKCANPDHFLMRYANDKIEKYCSSFGEVVGTAEDPIIFQTMFELEQFLGREIIWLRDLSFDQLIKKKGSLPIKQKRWCTTFLKIQPAFWFWFNYFSPNPVGFNVGYRFEEQERVNHFTTQWTFADYCKLNAKRNKQHLVHDVSWRHALFPLIEDKITRPRINHYWRDKNIKFADDSNCQHCMFKQIEQIRKNYSKNPNQIEWAHNIESNKKFNWHHDFSIMEAKSISLDLEFAFGDSDAGCQAGECVS